jgi:hypothetical protein
MTAGSPTDYSEYCEMEGTDDDPENEDESDSDEDASLASFCASLSGTSNNSSQGMVFMKRDASDKTKLIPIRKRRDKEALQFCSQCDADRSAEGTLSIKNKKLCIVCDVII